MSLGTILLIILILILIGALPTWPHSRSWGYFPSGAVGNLSTKQAPPSDRSVHHTSPPWLRAVCSTMLSPKPLLFRPVSGRGSE